MDSLSTILTDFDKRFGIIEKRVGQCEVHGDHVSSLVKHTQRWTGCPECAREAQSRAAQEEMQRRVTRFLEKR